jgi:methionine-rich copper-binding protein CopC
MKKLLLVLLLAGVGHAALAHAFLKRANPPVGSALAKLPGALVLSFTEDLEVPFCKVVVVGPNGAVAGHAPAAVPGHADELTIPLTPEGPGRYTVTWAALSVDTHHTQGSFTFTVTGG